MTEEEFNEIERQAKQRKEAVKAAVQYSMQKPKIGCVNHDCDQCKAQRTWVGLTDEEIKPCWHEACQTDLELTSQLVVYFARAIEAKLKEKNT